MPTDQDLITGIKRKEHDALKHLMLKYQHYVYTILISMLYKHEAEEAAQDVFIKVFKSINSFNQKSKLSTWLYSIAYRTGLDYIKKRKSNQNLTDNVNHDNLKQNPDIEAALDNQDLTGQLNIAILQLKNEDAAVLRMFYFRELSLKEICEITKLSASNVKVKLHRSRSKLKEIIHRENLVSLKEFI